MRTVAIIPLILLCACSGVMPTHFWDDFQPELIVENHNDQGPWGGHRATHWSTSQAGTFTPRTLIQFAAQNDWTFNDSMPYDISIAQRPHFPLDHAGLDTTVNNNSTHEYFPNWIHGPAMMYRFKTNWITVEPGYGTTQDALGYIVVDPEQKEMAVYHLWGE